MNQPNNQKERSPLFIFLAAAACCWGAAKLWPFAQSGDDLASLGAGLLALSGAALIVQGAVAWDNRRRRRSIENRSAQREWQHGTARWAGQKDIRGASMHRKDGLFLGRLDKQNLYYPGETHLLTIAPPGAGKGACIAVPNLLQSPRSMVVTDPKGELYAMTARHRREKLGHETIVLCPWAEKLSAELEMDIPDHGWNPLSILSDDANAKDEAELITSLLLPGKAQMSANDEYWLDEGRTILTGFILYMHSRFKDITLPQIRSRLFADPRHIAATLDDMAHSEAFGGALQEIGGKLKGAKENAPEQFEGALSNAQRALKIYDGVGPMADHISSGTLDFAALKHTPTTVYLIMPSDRAYTHAAWLNLVISLAIELVGRDRSNRKVLFLLDEFCNLGYLPHILRGMAQYRGQGVMVWAIIQQINQLERLYKKEGMQEMLGMAELVNTFGTFDPETLQLLSKWIGQRTMRQFSQNITPQHVNREFGFQYSASDHGSPLIRPEDIRTMPSSDQLILYRNLPAIYARKVSYLTERRLRRRADPNPYYRKSCSASKFVRAAHACLRCCGRLLLSAMRSGCSCFGRCCGTVLSGRWARPICARITKLIKRAAAEPSSPPPITPSDTATKPD